MTVAQLIAELKQMPQKAQVSIAYGYGDHWRTVVAPTVAKVEEGWTEQSGYHGMPKVSEDGEGETQTVLLFGKGATR